MRGFIVHDIITRKYFISELGEFKTVTSGHIDLKTAKLEFEDDIILRYKVDGTLDIKYYDSDPTLVNNIDPRYNPYYNNDCVIGGNGLWSPSYFKHGLCHKSDLTLIERDFQDGLTCFSPINNWTNGKNN